MAHIVLKSGSLKNNDEIYIIGNKTGVIRHKIDSIEVSGKKVDGIAKGQDAGIKVPFCFKGDEVYLIQKK